MRNIVVLVVVLAAVIASRQARGQDAVIGILEGNDYALTVDSVHWTLDNAPFPVWERTPGWESDSAGADTCYFTVPMSWPLKARPYYTLGGSTSLNYRIDSLVADTWYDLPVSLAGDLPQVPPRVMFVESLVVAVEAPPVAAVVRGFGAAPNPFTSRTLLTCDLGCERQTRIVLYDRAGRAVRTLVDATLPAGLHSFTWDGRDAKGNAVAAGVYIARLAHAGQAILTRITRID